jgi:hypothetical protein
LASAAASMMFLQIVELDLLDADVLGALRRQERIERDHLHPQPQRAVGDDRADVAAADHP